MVLVSAALIGCENSALWQMRRENRDAEQRIAVKQRQLEELETQQEKLRKRKQALLTELDERQMTIEQLDRALKNIRNENDRLVARTRDQNRRKQALEREFAAYQNQLDALNAGGMSLEDKERRLQELKATIRKYLTLDLTP